MAPRRRTPSLAGLAVALTSIWGTAALPDVPSVDNYLHRVWARATVLGNYVYIEGGEINQLVDGKKLSTAADVVNSTLSIDMSKSWKSIDVTIRSIPKPNPRKADVALWTDLAEGAFYTWGGRWTAGRNTSRNALWKFTADGQGGGDWAVVEPENPTIFNDLHPTQYGAFANTNTTGFVIGGVSHAYTEPNNPGANAVPGMVSFDMKTRVWQNGTTGFSPFGMGTMNQGTAHYVEGFGPDGLIFAMSGYKPELRAPKWTETQGEPRDLRNLTFFDPKTKKVYWQLATGAIPPTPRGQSCSTVFPTGDGGYDIFFYGGNFMTDNVSFQDAYILSLPGFVWARVPDAPGGPRQAATCVRVGQRQVLSIGGADNTRQDRDPAPQGLLLFDMTDWKWKDSYDAAAAAYERATELKTWYSNGSLGKVKWSSDEVRKLFVAASSEPNPDASSTPTSTPETGSGSSTPIGAIVGGVIGGVGGLALIAAAAWFLLRRRRRQADGSAPDPSTGLPEPTYDPKYEPVPNAVAEADGSHGYTELAARDVPGTYQFGGAIEMDSRGVPVELDATPRTSTWR